MAYIDKSKANIASKAILGLAHTANDRDFANEPIASGISMSGTGVFGQKINSTPGDILNTGIVSTQLILCLSAIAGTDGIGGVISSYSVRLANTAAEIGAAGANTVANVYPSLTGKTNPLTNAVYALGDRIGNIIPTKFGTGFRPTLYPTNADAIANTNEITPLSAADWYIDPVAGVITQEADVPGSMFVLGITGRVKAYVYIGKTVIDRLDEGTSVSSGGEWQDSVLGFISNTGTNPLSTTIPVFGSTIYNSYPRYDNTGSAITSTAINGQRYVYAGSAPIVGFTAYQKSTDTTTVITLPVGSILQLHDSAVALTTAGGWIVLSPATGMFTSVDSDAGAKVWYCDNGTAGTWKPQFFEATKKILGVLNAENGPLVISGSGDSLASNDSVFTILPVKSGTSASDYFVYVNGLKAKSNSYSLNTYAVGSAFNAVTLGTTTTFQSSSLFAAGTSVYINGSTTVISNIISVSGSGPYVYTIETQSGAITSVDAATSTLIDLQLVTFSQLPNIKLTWINTIATYSLESTDTLEIEYLIVSGA